MCIGVSNTGSTVIDDRGLRSKTSAPAGGGFANCFFFLTSQAQNIFSFIMIESYIAYAHAFEIQFAPK